MRSAIAAFLLVLLCATSCKEKQVDILANIKKQYAEINDKQKDLTVKKVDDITSPEGGKIIGYYKDDEVRKVVTQHFGEKSRSFSEYYFDDGELLLVTRQEFIYNKPNSYTEEKARAAGDSVWYDDSKTKMEVSRYYFHKNKLIKWVGSNDTDVPVNSSEFTEKEPILIAEALIALKQLKE